MTHPRSTARAMSARGSYILLNVAHRIGCSAGSIQKPVCSERRMRRHYRDTRRDDRSPVRDKVVTTTSIQKLLGARKHLRRHLPLIQPIIEAVSECANPMESTVSLTTLVRRSSLSSALPSSQSSIFRDMFLTQLRPAKMPYDFISVTKREPSQRSVVNMFALRDLDLTSCRFYAELLQPRAPGNQKR
jgi:hypothetical protein